ncbi:MAG: pectate lyase precursor [Polyangiaceae bacterium]|nr:pectate lyase precursor [Polyangiaceae bacterium]
MSQNSTVPFDATEVQILRTFIALIILSLAQFGCNEAGADGTDSNCTVCDDRGSNVGGSSAGGGLDGGVGSSRGGASSGAGAEGGGGTSTDGASVPCCDTPVLGDNRNTSPPPPPVDEGVRAFPGAEGFGALATGGRGGRVIKVTTLAASGPGSLQDALNQTGARIIVFEVSGVIESDLVEIPNGDVTIAGQTAPGGGITIAGRLYAAYDFDVGNMIIRHLRIRPDFSGSGEDGDRYDAIQFSRNRTVIFDHVSVAFGVDETVDLYSAEDVTFQWSTITMSATSGHSEGSHHNRGLINGPDGRRVSIHHTLFAHHFNRSPAIANGPAEIRNNVVYNFDIGFVHHNPASGAFNFVGNYFRSGDDGRSIPFYFDDENGSPVSGLSYYLSDNYIDVPGAQCDGVVSNPWAECDYDLFADVSLRATSEFDFSGDGQYFAPIRTQASADAYDLVLDNAGAFPRDNVTLTAISQVRDRDGTWGAYIPSNLMLGLASGVPPEDSDDDGIPDAWEDSAGLDAADPSDNLTMMPSGYSAIEQYINELADEFTSTL